MNKEIIQRYIQTALSNWFPWEVPDKILDNTRDILDSWKFVVWFWYKLIYDVEWWYQHFDLIEIITSKEFIEAIVEYIWWNNTPATLFKIKFHYTCKKDLIDTITTEQAIAIRDNHLEAFILKILWDES